MKIKDVKIGSQLRIGLGLMVLFVMLLGAIAWQHTDRIWQETVTIYTHPMQVTRAIGDLKTDILLIHRTMKDIAMAKSDKEIASYLQMIETFNADANRQFDVLYAQYLGPRSDIVSTQDDFAKWDGIRDETVRLIRAGQVAEGINRTNAKGIGGIKTDSLMNHLAVINKFASNKAEELYGVANRQVGSLNRQLVVLLCIAIGTSFLIAIWLMRTIKKPLVELTTVTDAFSQGRRHMRAEYEVNNEFGELARSFNHMADSIQTQMLIDEKTAHIADAMLRENDMRRFCQTVLQVLVDHTNSQMGAVYFLNDAKTEYDHYDSVGLNDAGRSSFSATDLDGEFGAALVTRQIQRIKDIPKSTRFNFNTVYGEFVPREILTVPVLNGQEVVAVISLASVRAYSAQALQLVEDIWSVLTARVNGMLAWQQTVALAHRLEQQNNELDIQTRELEMQTNELTEQNTELEMQKRQLDEANRLKSAFLSNMSHELRTPLNSVIALSGVLSRRLRDSVPEEEFSYLEVIERNGKSLLALINNILDLSRIEGGHEEVNVSRFYVHELVSDIIDMVEPQTMIKNISLTSQIGDGLPPVTSDYDKCRHILQNLVGNAVKFTEAGGVQIYAEPVGSELHISVHDSGIGITSDQLPHIFDEFRQADDSTSRKFGGTGLGLTIAQKYAHLIGGHITVESKPGEGSTFTLRLPISIEKPVDVIPTPLAPYRAPDDTQSSNDPSNCTYHILVVEDNGPAIIQLTDMLQTEGYHVSVARNGKEALAQIEECLPDAMILDLMMPEVDGFQVLGSIRMDERTESMPVLILTAKHVTKQELSFLKGNHIHQLIQKGDINRTGLLTAVAQMVAPAPERNVQRRRYAGTGKPVILVVEDNIDNMRTTKALLNEHYQLLEAEDGKMGVEKARSLQPDLILMDIALPVMDGFEALKEIRKDATMSDIPVIALTASAMKGNREDILAHGFDGYVSKPIDDILLHKTIREVLYGAA